MGPVEDITLRQGAPNNGPISKLLYHRWSVENIAVRTLYSNTAAVCKFSIKASVTSHLQGGSSEETQTGCGIVEFTRNRYSPIPESREHLQKTSNFHGRIHIFFVDFPINQSIDAQHWTIAAS